MLSILGNRDIIDDIPTVNNLCPMKLSKSSEKLANDISSMGFPNARVARVIQLIGNDDKTVGTQIYFLIIF